MKGIFAGVAVAAMGVSLAFAANDPMASRYGNTVVITGPDGKEVGRIYYDADKKTTRRMADGSEASGTWSLEGNDLCFTQTAPAAAPKQCQPFTGAKAVGESWDVATPQGKVKATLKQGRP